jgi:hypothetical protein
MTITRKLSRIAQIALRTICSPKTGPTVVAFWNWPPTNPKRWSRAWRTCSS